jgi:L-ascorbate metabolism protein UlaG (beta-lactamase superfamily)
MIGINKFYDMTVRKIQPELIIPIHWDNFFLPLNKPLKAPMKIADNIAAGLDYMNRRTDEDNISFKILRGYESIYLT